MRTICIYRDNQDYTRSVTDWLEDFRRQTGHEVETMNPDENTDFCQTYDILEYPTFIVLSDDGQVRERWSGRELPRLDDVLFYVTQ